MATNQNRLRKPKSATEERQVDELTLHEGHKIFPEPREHETAQLAEDVKDRGLQHPIEITPDGVIIAGQRRWLATKKLGRSTIRCRVRHDLAEKGPHAILQHLLADNLHRRHLSKLQQARAYLEFLKVSKDRPVPPGRERRDLVAAYFGCSGRRMERLVRILETPRAVQEAYEAGKLKQVTAESVAGLRPAQQHEIAAAIEAGECPYAAIAKFLPQAAAQPDQQKRQQPAQDSLQEVVTAVGKLLTSAERGELTTSSTEIACLRRIGERLFEYCDSAMCS
ncbi:MAG: ParB N-terminal domain-containing protein [Planctomycetaceae bacterium]|nr:ParB N-terminal domain-containing protein [Planctomycetaceae bacterium]